MSEPTDVPAMLERIKQLEIEAEEKKQQLIRQQQQLSDFQASKRRKLHGLNDVKTLGTRLGALRESHVKFCAKYAGGKSTPKTLPTRTKLLQFLDKTIAAYEAEFEEHLGAIEQEPPPKKRKVTPEE